MMKHYFVTAKVERFPGKSGWYYVPLPETSDDFPGRKSSWGMIPVMVTLGDTTWKTSLLPMGRGRLFIALKAALRKKYSITLGSLVTLTYHT
jgi:hypothetical protein